MWQKAVSLAGMTLVVLLIGVSFAIGGDGGVQAAQGPTPTLVPVPEPELGAFDLESVDQIDLSTFPLIPEISDQARLIYQDGLLKGNDPHTFAKVGDCMTDNPHFLIPIGEGDYDLGEYAHLQSVIDHFSESDPNSFSRISQASAGGFNSASILDSMWANPEFCEAGETPLSCEFRVMQPSVALIMFGTNDVFYLDESQFDYFLRSIIVETIRNGTLPVVSTFPTRPEFPEKSVLYNRIVAQAAVDYDVPLINLWLALESLPNLGVDPEETTHMTAPEGGAACYFIGPNLEAGFTMRNLLTLQALEAVLQAVDQE